jgi:mRNA-degrading endonuclease toxin of MazEF toxin-antitoxin module
VCVDDEPSQRECSGQRVSEERRGKPRVNITQVTTFDKSELTEKIGALSRSKLREVLSGLKLLFDEADVHET